MKFEVEVMQGEHKKGSFDGRDYDYYKYLVRTKDKVMFFVNSDNPIVGDNAFLELGQYNMKPVFRFV